MRLDSIRDCLHILQVDEEPWLTLRAGLRMRCREAYDRNGGWSQRRDSNP